MLRTRASRFLFAGIALAAAFFLYRALIGPAAPGRSDGGRDQARRLVAQLRDAAARPDSAAPARTATLADGRRLVVPAPPGAVPADLVSPLPEYAIRAAFLALDPAADAAASYALSEIVGAAPGLTPVDFADFRRRLRDSLGLVDLPASADDPLAVTLSPTQPILLMEDAPGRITTALRRRGRDAGDPAHTTALECFLLWRGAVLRLTLALAGDAPQPLDRALRLLDEWRAALIAANPEP